MNPEWVSALGLVAALALLVLGHLVRVLRWSLLLRQIGTPRSSTGFLALSLAYVLNAFLPLRLGEIARGVYYASRTRSDLAYVLATIVVERAFDLLAVWVLVLVFTAAGVFSDVDVWAWTAGAVLVVGGVFLSAVLVERSARFRYLVWLAASIFNPRIRLVILDGAWSLPEVLSEASAQWVRIVAQGAAMWALYLLSYLMLSRAVGVDFQRLFIVIHGAPLEPAFLSLLQEGTGQALVLLLYTVAPFALVLGYGIFRERIGVTLRGAISWVSDPMLYVHRLPRSRNRFSEAEQYSGFLMRRFSGASDLVSDFEANAIGDAVVQRMFRGGSDALTAMVQVGNELRIRKYALGSAAGKLHDQCRWLETHGTDLPLVRITDQSRIGSRFLYDMEYSPTSRDLFDIIHSSDIESSWRILEDVLNAMRALHERTRGAPAGPEVIERYAKEKVAGNLRNIQDAFPLFFDGDTVLVNGVRVDIGLLERFAAPDFVTSRIHRRETATIHGDLTIENILADPVRASHWFLIDPNVGNIFESPLLDYAKLLQSLHLGYESLNRDISCSYGDGVLTFPIARTAQYAVLHERATAWMRENLGEDGLREVRLHEVVHYFRLTPYKFRKGAYAGLVFLGCLCLLVQRYFDEYEDC
ncbi:lysylphosphatidylglycerol synthase transmembrane domain-containing protein [Muricoccus aerilatus]|uniref:lysylphosphatidylglycerol synthase transmembrane domain-containing protein n=1 Tax=Muricoccus aerilatus TaxID=452982 RepID=UPI0005C1F7AE|nr:lysylphosphatidylglycerol synthase domain-containing protein [Roseomonas aerilata]